MSKSIKQALIDEVFYPIPDGYIDNRILMRGLNAESDVSKSVMESDAFRGCVADCLMSVVEQSIDFTEADKSIHKPTDAQLASIKKRINNIYLSIGEEEQAFDSPSVEFGLG